MTINFRVFIFILLASGMLAFHYVDPEKFIYEEDEFYEEVNINQDSFRYYFSFGSLVRGETKGTISRIGDTLEFISNFKSTDISIRSANNPRLSSNEYHVVILGESLWFPRDLSWGTKYNPMINSPVKKKDSVFVELDPNWQRYYEESVTNSKIRFYRAPFRNSEKERILRVTIFRKSLYLGDGPIEFQFDMSKQDGNVIILDLLNYPLESDYVFFDNVKAVILDGKLIFIDHDSKPQRVQYYVSRNGKRRLSRKKRIKEFLKQ